MERPAAQLAHISQPTTWPEREGAYNTPGIESLLISLISLLVCIPVYSESAPGIQQDTHGYNVFHVSCSEYRGSCQNTQDTCRYSILRGYVRMQSHNPPALCSSACALSAVYFKSRMHASPPRRPLPRVRISFRAHARARAARVLPAARRVRGTARSCRR